MGRQTISCEGNSLLSMEKGEFEHHCCLEIQSPKRSICFCSRIAGGIHGIQLQHIIIMSDVISRLAV